MAKGNKGRKELGGKARMRVEIEEATRGLRKIGVLIDRQLEVARRKTRGKGAQPARVDSKCREVGGNER
jgi:hypothetical protein